MHFLDFCDSKVLCRTPETAPSNPRGSIEPSLRNTSLDVNTFAEEREILFHTTHLISTYNARNHHTKINPFLAEIVVNEMENKLINVNKDCHYVTVAQLGILFGRGQSMTSSVTDLVLSPTVPSVYFLTVKIWYNAPVKLFGGGMASSTSFWLRYCCVTQDWWKAMGVI